MHNLHPFGSLPMSTELQLCVIIIFESIRLTVYKIDPTSFNHTTTTFHKMHKQKQAKIEQQYTCNTCAKIFANPQELKQHQHSQHGPPYHHRPIQTQSNQSDTANIAQHAAKKHKSTRQLKKAQSIRLSDKNNQTENKIIEQKAQSQSHSEHEQPLNNNQSTVIIPQPPPVTPTEDLYQKIYLCGCTNKFFDHKQELSLHIKKQHLGFPPDGTLIGVSKQLVLRQFKPVEDIPKQTNRQNMNSNSKLLYRFVCGCGSRFTQLNALSYHIKKKHDGKQPQNIMNGLFKPPLEFSQEQQVDRSQSSNNQTSKDKPSKDTSKICTSCGMQCTGRMLVCRECKGWRYCGKCSPGAISRDWHASQGHRLHTN